MGVVAAGGTKAEGGAPIDSGVAQAIVKNVSVRIIMGQSGKYGVAPPAVKRKGQIKIECRVAEQNSHIGRRNVHELQAGQAKTVGGRRSDFLIFLVSVPHAIAELHYDGESCTFFPRDGRLFPSLDGPMPDCLDRDIAMVSPRGYPLTLRFVQWEDPGRRLNRLLHCIEVPGLDWEKRI